MTAEELVTHLSRHRRTGDLADMALLSAACEGRLTEVEELVCAGDKRMDMLRDEFRAHEA
jgi:hypothetical protein